MIEEKLVKLQEENNKLLLELRQKYEDMEKNRVTPGEFLQFKEKIENRFMELDKLMVNLSAPPKYGDAKAAAAPTDSMKIFVKALRYGYEALTPEERKVMTISDPATGGFLAPAEYTAEIIKGIVEYSPLRSVARVVQTRARSKQWPKKTGSASASWVGEIGTRSETTNPKYGLEEIPTHELYALAVVSRQDLEDSAFNLEAELRNEFAEQFGVAEGTAFIAGNGVNKPQGILTHPDVTGFTGVTTSGKVVADDLKQVFYLLKEPYARNAVWLWNRKTTLAISLLKDSGTGAYLWRPGLEAGTPPNVLGRPYIECPDMPEEGSSAKAVAVGDFSKAYIIVDRLDIEIMPDPYTSKSTGCIEFSARKRVGGQVVLPEAVKIYTLKA